MRPIVIVVALLVAACGLLVDSRDVDSGCAHNGECLAGWYCLESYCVRIIEPQPCEEEVLPGEWSGQSCGRCGLQVRQCLEEGHFGRWSPCDGQGRCTPDADEARAGRSGAVLVRTCTDACEWGRWRCTPNCDLQARECGDDGCGGTCGRCVHPFVCGPDNRCTQPTLRSPEARGDALPGDAASVDWGAPDAARDAWADVEDIEPDAGDAGGDATDVGVDAVDAEPDLVWPPILDATVDGGPDVSADGMPDASSDDMPDATADNMPDASVDGLLDASAGGAVDAHLDARPEDTPDAAADVEFDASPDAPLDAATDVLADAAGAGEAIDARGG